VLAVLYDIHRNLPALEEVLKDADAAGALSGVPRHAFPYCARARAGGFSHGVVGNGGAHDALPLQLPA
jgi:hypothetical protein